MSRRIVALFALVAGACVVAGVAWAMLRGGDDADTPQATLTAFADAWSRGDDTAAAQLTDAPAVARRALVASRQGLDDATVRVVPASTTASGNQARGRIALRWAVPGFGPWTYRSRVALRRVDGQWRVVWRPTVVHPALDSDTRLGTRLYAEPRGSILDRDGRALVKARPVMHVSVHVTRRGPDPDTTADALADVLDIDAPPLARALRDAKPDHYVPVITLRLADYNAVADRLAAIDGVSLARDSAQLAPRRGFGAALLGAVGPATAEQIKRSDGRLSEGDEVGQWGLEATHDQQLAARPGHVIVVRSLDDGSEVETLATRRGRAGRPLRTTLDLDAQEAAENALDGVDGAGALVAIQPSTGDVLAVANRPVDDAFDRAIDGRYPPGSTFKVVSTAALLDHGLDPSTIVPCPPTATVGGRSFKNFEGEAAGDVSFATDFAQSCNTAFVSLAPELPADRLQEIARSFGLGATAPDGARTARASVPPGRDLFERAASMIGQARIVASPLAMAGVAGTVADGRWRAPRLLADDPRAAGAPLDPALRSQLRSLMRSVVTSGTGTALAGLPAEPAGKSGTAEYGAGDPPPTHAWFIAYRGDVALAVLVEEGSSGAGVAAPLAARFLTAYDGG
jgi:cell division protein FtsI/penicillin-binding protein 2